VTIGGVFIVLSAFRFRFALTRSAGVRS
jgi:hypothetical protein